MVALTALLGVGMSAGGAHALPSGSQTPGSGLAVQAEADNPPAPPTAIAGNAQVTVFWTPAPPAALVTDYSVHYRVAGSGVAWVEIRKGNAFAPYSVTAPLLINGTAYEFQLAYVTGVAPGVAGTYSASSFVRPGSPVYVTRPTISGTAVVGSTLTAVDPDSNWSSADGTPMTATYQWQSNDVDIAGATSPQFVVTAAQAGTTVRVIASRRNTSGNVSATSDEVPAKLLLGTYLPLPPVRLLDTRNDPTTGTAKLAAGSVRVLHIAGTNGVPADATAVVLNVTATEPDAPGFETVYPCGGPVPTASNVNWVAGQTIPNRVISALDTTGNVCLFSYATTHLVVDLNGAYSATAGTSPYLPLPPHRLLDTRDSGVKTTAGSIRELQVSGSNGVPGDATAVVLNVTATQPDAPGFVTVFPCGRPVPTASNVNFTAGQTISNSVTATVGVDGKVCLFTYAATHLVVDLNGAYSPTQGSARFVATAPHRLLDTRDTGVKTGVGSVQVLQVTGSNGVPANATAVVLNVTSTESNGPGFVTVFPCGTAIPTASNVNYDAGQTIPISATATLAANGTVCLFTYSSTHLVVDLDGIYAPPT